MSRRVEIVGAGLAGLTAAIHLAGEGYEVVVYEKEKKIGGIPSARPDPAGGPFGLPRLKAYVGFDISPAVKPLERTSLMLWGRMVEMKARPDLPLYMVERGSRKSSLDSFLAGTLAGAIDPLMGFGMLGAMLSGKIAALAQEDRQTASTEFRRLNVLYAPELFVRKLLTASPTFVRRGLARVNAAVFNRLPDRLLDLSYRFVPGYGRMG